MSDRVSDDDLEPQQLGRLAITRVPAAEANRPHRREQPRVKMQAQIDFGSVNNFFSGFSTDLSDGGVFVVSNRVMEIGTEVDLTFTLPGSAKIEAKGAVRWVRAASAETMPGMGVQFTQLEEKDRAAIRAFIETREPMFFAE